MCLYRLMEEAVLPQTQYSGATPQRSATSAANNISAWRGIPHPSGIRYFLSLETKDYFTGVVFFHTCPDATSSGSQPGRVFLAAGVGM